MHQFHKFEHDLNLQIESNVCEDASSVVTSNNALFLSSPSKLDDIIESGDINEAALVIESSSSAINRMVKSSFLYVYLRC